MKFKYCPECKILILKEQKFCICGWIESEKEVKQKSIH